jgi:hypothetical protein
MEGRSMQILKLFGVVAVAALAVSSTAFAQTAPQPASQTVTIDVNHGMPSTLKLKAGDTVMVVTDNEAPGGAAIKGAECFDANNGTNTVLSHGNRLPAGGTVLLTADHPGACTMLIQYSHRPSNPHYTQTHIIDVDVVK